MLTYAQRLVTERDHLTAMANETAERAAKEERDLTETETATIKGWQERCDAIDAQLKQTTEQLASTRAWAKLRSELTSADDQAGGDLNGHRFVADRRPANVPQVRSWGDTFLDSEAFRDYGGAGASGRVAMPYGLLERQAFGAAGDAITTAMIGETVMGDAHQFTPPVPSFPRALTDLVNREPVGVGAIEYFYFRPSPPAAAPVVNEGAVKPPMPFDVQEVSAALKTYAHWKAITRQALEDYPRLRAIIETYLREGLLWAIENGIANAIATNPDIGTTAPGTDTTSLLAAVRIAMAQVEANGYRPNTLLLNTADWATMDVAVMVNAGLAPTVGQNFWGLTPVTSTVVEPGTAYVGDLRRAVTLFDRNVTNIFITDSHVDFFLSNKLVILAETRALPAVVEPAAIEKAVGEAGSIAVPAGVVGIASRGAAPGSVVTPAPTVSRAPAGGGGGGRSTGEAK